MRPATWPRDSGTFLPKMTNLIACLFSNVVDHYIVFILLISPLSSLLSDIIDILQLQYKPFLLLAAQLQTIHEQVQVNTGS